MAIQLPLFLDAVDIGGIKDLSASSVALCIMALGRLDKRYFWRNGDNKLTDVEWDSLDADISLALEEIMSSMVGYIVPAVLSSVSAFKLIPCDGGTYLKSDYPLLYDAIDSMFILSGTQFTVPDLRDKFLAGAGGSYSTGDTGGSNSHTLTVSEIPAHTHGYSQPTYGVDIESVGVPDPTGVGNPPVPLQTGTKGGGGSHENRPPYYAIPFYIIAG